DGYRNRAGSHGAAKRPAPTERKKLALPQHHLIPRDKPLAPRASRPTTKHPRAKLRKWDQGTKNPPALRPMPTFRTKEPTRLLRRRLHPPPSQRTSLRRVNGQRLREPRSFGSSSIWQGRCAPAS